MEKSDIFNLLGTIVSAIFSAVTWFWNIQPLNFLFTLILGSFITYFIQSKLQDRTEKRKIIRDIIEKIYGPLYNEIINIKDNLINDINIIYPSAYDLGGEGKCEVWEKIKKYPEYFSIPRDLKNKIEQLIYLAININGYIEEIDRIVNSIIFEFSNSLMAPNFQNIHGVFLVYKSTKGKILFSQQISKYTLLDKDPIEDIKKQHQDFSIENLNISLTMGASNILLPFQEVKEKIYKIIELSKDKIYHEKEVSKYINDRTNLSEILNEVLPKIEKYIDKNYPTMKL